MNILRLISDADADLLKKYAARVCTEGICLEIGSCHGASTAEILSTLPLPLELICSSLHGPDDYPLFKAHCVEAGCWHRVLPVTGDFRQLQNHVVLKPLAFLFLDHDHSEAGMKDAFSMLLPLCAPGCILMFHDYHNTDYPAVVKYVDSLPPNKYKRVEIIETMAVLQAV